MAIIDCFAAESDNLVDNLFRWRKSIARQAKRRLHDECIGFVPFRLLSGFPRPQFEIPRVKKRLVTGENETLCRTKDVTGGQ